MSHNTGYFESPWSGRLHERKSPANSSNVQWKGKEKVDYAPTMPNLSACYDDVDGHSSGFDHSLDEEFGIPAMKMLGVKKAMEDPRKKLRIFAWFKKPVQ